MPPEPSNRDEFREPEAVSSSAGPAHRRGIAFWIATGLGFGLSPVMPGTVGGLWGVPLTYLLFALPSPWLAAGVLMALFLVSIPISTAAARQLGRKDPGAVVIDEIVSLPLVYWGFALSPAVVAIGFVLHRVFDIAKPPPARQLEQLPDGTGIMADDIAAAIYAQLTLRLLVWLGWLPQ